MPIPVPAVTEQEQIVAKLRRIEQARQRIEGQVANSRMLLNQLIAVWT
jgi:restriction endonuclease S subunit